MSAEAEQQVPASGSAEAEATPAAEEAPEEEPRVRVSETRVVGLVIEWRGYMGWIHPLEKLDHEKAKKHQGRIYINQKDVVQTDGKSLRIKEGKIVDFLLYADHDGLGAEECRPRIPIRLTLPHGDANRTTKKGAQWSEYLSDSEYFPTFEKEHGVMLRKYTWPMSFALIELWGHPEELSKAVVNLVKKADEEEDACEIRLLLPERDIPKVEALPHSPKVSTKNVIGDPMPCRSLIVEGSKENCAEVVKAYAVAMAGPQVGAA